MENFNTMQKLFGKHYLGLPLLILIIWFVCYLFTPTNKPTYRVDPYENKKDTTKTSDTDWVWWLLLAG